MSVDFIFIYTLTVFVATIIPGPSMLLAVTHGMKFGARKTLASALGNVTVTFIQASVSLAGLGTVLLASESVFNLIKWAGAAYLVYVGASMLFSSSPLSSPGINGPDNDRSPIRMFIQASVVTAGNPKAILFFTAIFPQFIVPGSAFIRQYVLLMSILITVAFVCFMIYAISGQKMVSLFAGPSTRIRLNRVIGGTFIGTGIGLAFSRR
jgi:threonine/homoserine/homoserine lactone efflux protein